MDQQEENTGTEAIPETVTRRGRGPGRSSKEAAEAAIAVRNNLQMMDDILQEGEQTMTVQMAGAEDLRQELTTFDQHNGAELYRAAKALGHFIRTNNLSTSVGKKQYINVEGWQFIFALAGMNCIIDEPVRDVNAPWYEAAPGVVVQRAAFFCTANLYDRNQNLVGRGVGYCSNEPGDKAGYQTYAVLSFAQTRAQGKCGRNKFAFLAKEAGYEATPSEEMDGVSQQGTIDTKRVNTPPEPIRTRGRRQQPGVTEEGQPTAPATTVDSVSQENPLTEVDPVIMTREEEPEEPISEGKKREIISLLNNPLIPAEQKNRLKPMLENMSEAKGEELVKKLMEYIRSKTPAHQLPRDTAPTQSTPGISAEGPVINVSSSTPVAETTIAPTAPAEPPKEPASPEAAPVKTRRGRNSIPPPAGAVEATTQANTTTVSAKADSPENERQPIKPAFTGLIGKAMFKSLQEEGADALEAIKEKLFHVYDWQREHLDLFQSKVVKAGYSLGQKLGYPEYDEIPDEIKNAA